MMPVDATPPANGYHAHVTDEWQTDTVVVQVRQTYQGHTAAIGQVLEDRDGMAVMQFRPLPNNRDGREHLEPTPGIRLRSDVAVAMARAILTEAGRDADEVGRLKAKVEDLEMTAHESAVEVQRQMARADDLQNQVTLLERLVEAKEAHLEREARTSDHFHRPVERQANEDDVASARALHPAAILKGAEPDPDWPFREGQMIGYPATLEVQEDDAQRITQWAVEVASHTGQEVSEVLKAYQALRDVDAAFRRGVERGLAGD